MRRRRLDTLFALLALLIMAGALLRRFGDVDAIPEANFEGVTRRPPPPEMDDLPEKLLQAVEMAPPEDGYVPLRLVRSGGEVAGRYYPVPGAREAAIWVGGAGGGWDTPARGLYPRLCDDLRGRGIASLRVRFRAPTDLGESLRDVLAGVSFLQGEGVEAVALVGHSFGGAVVIRAAAHARAVRTVITLATQGYGTEPVRRLGPHCSVLLIHGTADRVLRAHCSEDVFRRALEPKRLLLLPGADHGLDEATEEVSRAVGEWIPEQLRTMK